MRVLSVHQPWATLLALGLKRLETRSWQTRHRGKLGIHATRRRGPSFELPSLWWSRVAAALHRYRVDGWPGLFPRGAVLGVVDLLACVKVEEMPLESITADELLLGDFSANRWIWRLGLAQPLRVPLLLQGQQGVFEAALPDPLPGLSAPGEDCHGGQLA